ncbi:MAG: 23S rRNA (adenine(2503)-C(2))-methyltransferase RlmN [Kiritimatiellales bacterium]
MNILTSAVEVASAREAKSAPANSVYSISALESACRDAHRRKLFCNAFFKQGLPLAECLRKAPELAGAFNFHPLELMERHDSKIDGATKLVFQTADGYCIESVILRIATGRTSLCISSQIGCPAKCTFCATGALQFIRSLTAGEILDQVTQARRLLRGEGRALRNVVFMGMGEPLLNCGALFESLELLRDTRFFNFSGNHLLVSTAGIPAAVVEFTAHFPAVRLAFSLHSAQQEVREKLMPVAKIHTLKKLKAAFPENFMIEYLMLQGVNDSPADAAALIGFLAGTNAHINLIQFNPYPGAPFEPVSKAAREAFGKELRRAGFKTTLRYSLGDDIAAACGQLAGK